MTCKTHPDAPHGFDRNASHGEDRYVCECESWEPPEQTKPMGVSCPRCGKTGLQPDSIHTCTPLALRLADILGCSALQCDVDAAAELRRLHAENEAMRRMSFDSKYDEVKAENEALRQLTSDLLSALEYHEEQTRPIHSTTVAIEAARAALARAGEVK